MVEIDVVVVVVINTHELYQIPIFTYLFGLKHQKCQAAFGGQKIFFASHPSEFWRPPVTFKGGRFAENS